MKTVLIIFIGLFFISNVYSKVGFGVDLNEPVDLTITNNSSSGNSFFGGSINSSVAHIVTGNTSINVPIIFSNKYILEPSLSFNIYINSGTSFRLGLGTSFSILKNINEYLYYKYGIGLKIYDSYLQSSALFGLEYFPNKYLSIGITPKIYIDYDYDYSPADPSLTSIHAGTIASIRLYFN